MSINADEIITQKHKRAFIQFGGAAPTNPIQYYGQDAQYMSIEGVTVPEVGGVDPIHVHDPNNIGRYKLVGRSETPPDLATATLIMYEKHGAIPRQLYKQGCTFNLYEPTGLCQDLSDFINGWSDYVLIYSAAIVTDKDLGSRVSFDSDDNIEDSLSITLSEVYPIGKMGFGESATTQVDREVVDLVYGPPLRCAGCTEGSERVYALTAPSGVGSPGLPAELVYTLDSGANWSQSNIDGLGATETVYAIDIAGSYLVVLGDDAYYYATINQQTGVPGAFSKVSFSEGEPPYDIYVANPREVYFCGADGYIYKSTNIAQGATVISDGSATSENLMRIHGQNETIVAAGYGGAIVVSTNRGVTWASAADSPCTDIIQALFVIDSRNWWIGTDAGNVYFTRDGGNTWTEQTFSGSGTGNVYDILFPTDEVGYISHSTAAPAGRIFTTWNGGADWASSADYNPRLVNFPVLDAVKRIATPVSFDPAVACNNMACGGLAGDGVDGIILLATASRL